MEFANGCSCVHDVSSAMLLLRCVSCVVSPAVRTTAFSARSMCTQSSEQSVTIASHVVVVLSYQGESDAMQSSINLIPGRNNNRAEGRVKDHSCFR